jgi:hypothetical protein
MDRLDPKNNNIEKRGKTIRTLIKELESFSNQDLLVKTLWEEDQANGIPPKAVTQLIKKENYYLLSHEGNEDCPICIRELLQAFSKIEKLDLEVRFEIENTQKDIGIGLVGKLYGACVLFSSE